MSTPKKPPSGGKRRPLDGGGMPASTPRAAQAPMTHNGRPPGGKHVESSAPGGGAYDYSAAVGSNVTPSPGRDQDSEPEILDALPWAATYPTASMANPPMF